MFCGKCGKDNLDGVKFCVGCGADLLSQTRVGASAPSAQDLVVTSDAPPVELGRQIRSGEVLAGQYRIVGEKPLGAGGMGEVWRGEDTELGTPVAIKVLPPMLARNEIAVTNLRKEAMIGRQLTHHNICRLYSFHTDGAMKFIVMEFVSGKTLQQMLMERDEHRLSLEELAPIARQLAEALDYAHTVTYSDSSGRQVCGVLHRDIKPGNIMVTPDGTAKLMDFGIAREMHDTLTEVTGRTSQTPLYASPEQFCGKPVTAASDIYSLANVFYECLASQRLVTPHGDLAWQIINRPYEPLSSLPQYANDAMAAALAKDPQARPATARAFAERLTGVATVPAPTPTLAAATLPAAPAAAAPKSRAKLFIGLAAAVVVAGAAIAAALTLGSGRKDSPAQPSPTPAVIASNNGTPSPTASGAAPTQMPEAAAASPTPVPAATPAPTAAAETLGKEFTNTVGMKFVRIAPGDFQMGSPATEAGRGSDESLHAARVNRPFYLGVYEVTQGQWKTVMSENPSQFKGDDNLPVDSMSWHRAVEFCDTLSTREHRKYRLPTETEWEYACRAGTTGAYYTGAGLTTGQANYDGTFGAATQAAGENRNKTTPVGSFGPNAWGLYDMHGNVWEWCNNVYCAYGEEPPREPAGSKVAPFMSLRGGSWRSKAGDCRSACRYKDKSTAGSKNIGLRVLMEIE